MMIYNKILSKVYEGVNIYKILIVEDDMTIANIIKERYIGRTVDFFFALYAYVDKFHI